MVGKGLYINIGLTSLDTSEIQVRRMVEVGARPCAVENSGILGTICWQIFFDNHSKLVYRSWMSGKGKRLFSLHKRWEGTRRLPVLVVSSKCHQHNVSKQRACSSIASHVNRKE